MHQISVRCTAFRWMSDFATWSDERIGEDGSLARGQRPKVANLTSAKVLPATVTLVSGQSNRKSRCHWFKHVSGSERYYSRRHYNLHLMKSVATAPALNPRRLVRLCSKFASDLSSTRRPITDTQTQQLPEAKQSNPSKDDWQQIYIGRSGDPWGGMSMEQQETIDSRIPPVNFTYNNSNDYLQMHRQQNNTHSRSKRGVVHLYNMVVCATGCNPLDYKGYGCYCGFLGSGYVIDGIDKCCKMHDWCYDATDCPMFSEYFVPYYWKCYQGYKPICAVEHGNWGGSGSCSQRLCECDRSLAECLRRFPCPTTKAMCTSSPWRLVQNLFMVM